MKIDKLVLSIVKTFLQWACLVLLMTVMVVGINVISTFCVSIGIAPILICLFIILLVFIFILHIKYNYKNMCRG